MGWRSSWTYSWNVGELKGWRGDDVRGLTLQLSNPPTQRTGLDIDETMNGYRVGIVGATGVVGREALRVLQERNFPASTLKLFASSRSAGRRIGSHVVEEASRAAFHDLELVIFDTPDEVARELVPLAAASGTDRKSTRLNSSHLVISYAVF